MVNHDNPIVCYFTVSNFLVGNVKFIEKLSSLIPKSASSQVQLHKLFIRVWCLFLFLKDHNLVSGVAMFIVAILMASNKQVCRFFWNVVSFRLLSSHRLSIILLLLVYLPSWLHLTANPLLFKVLLKVYKLDEAYITSVNN